MKAERVVLDTNVLISAAISAQGNPRRIYEHVRAMGQLLICPPAIEELETRLARPKFDKYISQAARREFIDALYSTAEIVAIPGVLRVCRDPDDDKILEAARVGLADCLVTGGTDLLSLRLCGEAAIVLASDAVFQSVAILRPTVYVTLAGLT